jgi:hypothetical protein
MMRIAGPIALLVAAPLLAADPPKLSVKSGKLEPPNDLKPAIRDLLDSDGTTVSDRDVIATFWLRKDIPVKDAKSYRSIAAGTLIGVVRLARPWIDFRGNEAPAGDYTLRLAVQPESKDHEGTAPFRDFVILVPAAVDAKPEVLPLKTLIEKSGSATGGTHPVVMLLLPHAKPPVEPVIIEHEKRLQAVGVKGPAGLGWAFTVRGTGVDK